MCASMVQTRYQCHYAGSVLTAPLLVWVAGCQGLACSAHYGGRLQVVTVGSLGTRRLTLRITADNSMGQVPAAYARPCSKLSG